MNKIEILNNIIIPLISSFIGGGLTVIGVLMSIHHENKNRKDEIKRLNKPLIYLINPMQDYDYKSAIQFVFRKEKTKSDSSIEIILKNTDNAILIMDSIKINDSIYYPYNGNVVDKNTIFYIYIDVEKMIRENKQNDIFFSIKDVAGNIYKYKLTYHDENSDYIDVIEEINFKKSKKNWRDNMLKIFIGPNGYGKTYELNKIHDELKKNKQNDCLFLGSELVFADEMKDTVNSSFLMDYIITELLVDDELVNLQKQFENKVDLLINDNSNMYNKLMDETLRLNNQERTKNVIETQKTKEYKKLIKINSNDLKEKMGSGQKLHFLLRLIEKSNKKYIFIDEPENHSHPSLLYITADLINKISIDKDVYIATHSPLLLSLLNVDFEEVYILNDSDFHLKKKIDFEDAINVNNNFLIENLKGKSKSYYNVENLKKNIKEIHNNNFFESLFSKKVYIVEGINDELFLKRLLVVNGKQNDNYSIFCSYGKHHMIPFIKIFRQLGLDVKVLYDSDEQQHPEDENLKNLNIWIKNNSNSYCFNDNLEKEIGFTKKENTPEFISFLDSFDFSDYKDILL